ncbi:hypothetical protein RADP37_05497 (plasmid) [Roseomonas mucosa]|uniref:Uncharacterized protein n=1 Tax=Roseomonas mucosa TaxID=207340 RepID=A0A4Y1MPU3_9PROT|nr:hypothetical protein RADP37_05497 [Roseomonas mucosa]
MDADASAPAALRNGRGRPPKALTETAQQRVARLKAELDAAETALRAEADRQAALVGQVVVAQMAKDAELRRRIAALLRAEVKRKEDRATIASLLIGD